MSGTNSEIFGAMLQACGLDFRSAAELLCVDPDTVLVWFTGTTAPDEKALWKLAEFARFQSEIADEILEMWEMAGRPLSIKYGVSVSDLSAKKLGWPSRAAQVAAVAQAQVALAPVLVEVVPIPSRDGSDIADSTAEADHAA